MSVEVASAPAIKAVKPGYEETSEVTTYPIRMTLSSTKMKAVEQGKLSSPHESNVHASVHLKEINKNDCQMCCSAGLCVGSRLVSKYKSLKTIMMVATNDVFSCSRA
jgi:hypothetical protein